MKNQSRSLIFKLFESHPETADHPLRPGSVISDSKTNLKIACKGGLLNILSLQAEGKKRMNTPEFLRGFKISDWVIDVSSPA